jgi:hypothetical protein
LVTSCERLLIRGEQIRFTGGVVCEPHHASWCIFDNTALGVATANALDLWARLTATDRGDTLATYA